MKKIILYVSYIVAYVGHFFTSLFRRILLGGGSSFSG